MGKSNVKSKQVRIHKKQRQQLKSVTDRKKLVKEKHSLLLKHGQKNKIVRWDNEVSLISQFKSANKCKTTVDLEYINWTSGKGRAGVGKVCCCLVNFQVNLKSVKFQPI